MRVLVCVKRVPAPGAKINLTEDGQGIDTKHLGFTMSPHEECAMEEAIQIAEREGGTATILTLGPAEAEEQLRYGVSIGCSDAVLIPTGGEDVDPMATARSITDAIRTLEERDGAFDLILFGNESADSGGYQVGVRCAYALDRPMIGGVKNLETRDGIAIARRETGVGFEEYHLEMPAVLGVKEGINLPRYPTMKGRLAARKAEVDQIEPTGAAGGQTMIRLRPTVEAVTETEILGEGPDAAARIVDILEEIGALS
jgi:electron transfer flavoprotein beta subunit